MRQGGWEGGGNRPVRQMLVTNPDASALALPPDVSRFAGEYEHVFESTTAGVTIQAPQLDINTVAAGGGSRLFFRSGGSAALRPGRVRGSMHGQPSALGGGRLFGVPAWTLPPLAGSPSPR